jgi:RimJ/RimL family protein N-acetyltransferase
MELPPPETLALRDGTRLSLRPIRPDDAPRLQALHSRLSAETIFLRFMGMRPVLPPDEAREFATLDYHTRMAFVAAQPEDGDERLVGVARYAVVSPQRPGEAEAAIVIEDSFQNRGLGTVLLDRLLTFARGHGITAFVAEINAENERMMKFVRHSGLPTEKRLADGVWEIRVKIQSDKT